VERRDEGLDVGLERLRRVVTLADPETVCRTVMHEIVGSSTPMDDIAVFVVRRDEFVEADELPARRASRRIEATSTAPRDARRFAVQAAGPLPTETRDTLELLVSELATNVVVHSKTPFGVGVTRFPDAVLVEIHDHGEGTVAARNAAPADPSGRGLAIVNALATAWGVRTQDGEAGKAVWFRLDVADDHAAALHLNAALLAVT
jgi:anti-sigma regulatory factor (Ser/Thr protein kinase)